MMFVSFLASECDGGNLYSTNYRKYDNSWRYTTLRSTTSAPHRLRDHSCNKVLFERNVYVITTWSSGWRNVCVRLDDAMPSVYWHRYVKLLKILSVSLEFGHSRQNGSVKTLKKTNLSVSLEQKSIEIFWENTNFFFLCSPKIWVKKKKKMFLNSWEMVKIWPYT